MAALDGNDTVKLPFGDQEGLVYGFVVNNVKIPEKRCVP
jgi:hypothetical protein